MKIPFSPPDIGEEEIAEVIDTLRSGWITTGPKTKEFERRIAQYCNTQKAVCLNSSTACMEMTLRLFGIGEGDEVITTAYTYTASASIVCHVGAKLVLVDTAPNSFHLDYEQLEKAITPRTKAIIPVDIAGVMCDYDTIYQIVERKRALFSPSTSMQLSLGRILVLADASHAFGAEYKGKKCGEVADFSSFSFHAVKNLTTAEGGAVVWREIAGIESEEIYKQFMLLTLHGQTKDALAKTKLGSWEYDIISPAYKCNMTDIMASIGLAQLKRYDTLLQRRQEIMERYRAGIEDINQSLQDNHRDYSIQSLEHRSKSGKSSGHLYLIRIVGKEENYRNQVIESMAELGVATNVHYKPLPLLTAYKNLGFSIERYPNAYDMYHNEISLPLHTSLTTEEVDFVIQTLKSCTM